MIALIGAVSVGVVVPILMGGAPHANRPAMSNLVVLAASLTSGFALLVMSIRDDSWLGTKVLACGLFISCGVQAATWIALGRDAAAADLAVEIAEVILLVVFLTAAMVEFRQHVRRDRVAIFSDVALISTLTGVAVTLFFRYFLPSPTPVAHPYLMSFTVVVAVVVFSAWSMLVLWCPTPIHGALFGCATLLAASSVISTRAQPHAAVGSPEMTLLVAFAVLGMAAVLVVEPRLAPAEPRPPVVVWWLRPGLLAFSIGATCIMILMALLPADAPGAAQDALLFTALTAAIALRTSMDQLDKAKTARRLGSVLAEREAVTHSLRAARDAAWTSEARLNLLLESAVDGIVELDAYGRIVRANHAFAMMIDVPQPHILQRRWEEVAAGLPGTEEPLAALPTAGHARLEENGQTVYLEARTSQLPGNPPGTLLLIRDVTTSKVPEQTIRSLFQFLQDKDEDRTKILKRTDMAIEAERNRIARDLHDGPIQGIAAASLSLEAVRMMIESGDAPRAAEMLRSIRRDLAEEGNNLRRLMSDLRPPVLEERGLIPAVHDLCDRWSGETGIPVRIRGGATAEIPADVETLAYRVVQEALSNISKHAHATQIWVRIEATYGTLYLEVGDDGIGFQSSEVREFLHRGRVGLASMRERAELRGGTLVIQSEPGRGTTVIATLPYELMATAPPLKGATTA